MSLPNYEKEFNEKEKLNSYIMTTIQNEINVPHGATAINTDYFYGNQNFLKLENGKIKCLKSGTLEISGCIQLTSQAQSGNLIPAICRNTDGDILSEMRVSNTFNGTENFTSGTLYQYVNEGDTIYLYLGNFTGQDITINPGFSKTRLTIKYIE